MSLTTPGPTLSPSHPLVAELSALRYQLGQYQRAAHQSAIQVQAGRLELELARDEAGRLRDANEALRIEIDVLRGNPEPPSEPPASHTLTELSLAHRRLSTKLDLTEATLAAAQLELAAAKQEIFRLGKAREADAYAISELRRVEDDRLEEVEWERAERRKVEEQKRLCDLALAEYQNLVKSLDPDAVPAALPESDPSAFSLNAHPPSPAPTASSSSESISNLLIGQRGVHQLFHDFTTTLSTKERTIHALEADVETTHAALGALRTQLEAETARRVAAQAERDRAVRDDASAASVVERYMTFSQKSHQTVHRHLSQLRTRATATQAGLRAEIDSLDRRLRAESERCAKLRRAADETGAELAREAAGRRREIALRLGMIAELERRARRVEAWVDRVRRATSGTAEKQGADALLALLQEGVVALEEKQPEAPQRGWRKLVGRSRGTSDANMTVDDKGDNAADSAKADSLARVAHAEELVMALVQDLQAETEKRIELERQRVEWLAKEAEGGGTCPAATDTDGEGTLVFDVDDEDERHESAGAVEQVEEASDHELNATAADVTATLVNGEAGPSDSTLPTQAGHSSPACPPEPSPALVELHAIFDALSSRIPPLQKALHDQSIALSNLRPASSKLPPSISTSLTSSSIASTSSSKRPFVSLSRRPDPVTALLDALHEVIEDARVDVEIALADEDRVCAGFEALLGVGLESVDADADAGTVAGGAGRKMKADVLADAREYVDARLESDIVARLGRRVDDVGADLAQVKVALHELAGVGADDEPGKARAGEVWARVELRTVAVPSSSLTPTSAPAATEDRRASGPGLFNGMRSLSTGIVRKGSGLALLRRGEAGAPSGQASARDSGDSDDDGDVE
ncbi:hypothetical protein Q5752_001676 [Cryptotrichosporon argae]